jgi:hypothetical protein
VNIGDHFEHSMRQDRADLEEKPERMKEERRRGLGRRGLGCKGAGMEGGRGMV